MPPEPEGPLDDLPDMTSAHIGGRRCGRPASPVLVAARLAALAVLIVLAPIRNFAVWEFCPT